MGYVQVADLKASQARRRVKNMVLAWRHVARILGMHRRALTRPKAECFTEWRYQAAKQAMESKAHQLLHKLSTRRCPSSRQTVYLMLSLLHLQLLPHLAPVCCVLYNTRMPVLFCCLVFGSHQAMVPSAAPVCAPAPTGKSAAGPCACGRSLALATTSKSCLCHQACTVLMSCTTCWECISHKQVLLTLHTITPLHCRCWRVWLALASRSVQARSRAAAFCASMRHQALQRLILQAWFGYSRLMASERKAQVQSQPLSPLTMRCSCCLTCPSAQYVCDD